MEEWLGPLKQVQHDFGISGELKRQECESLENLFSDSVITLVTAIDASNLEQRLVGGTGLHLLEPSILRFAFASKHETPASPLQNAGDFVFFPTRTQLFPFKYIAFYSKMTSLVDSMVFSSKMTSVSLHLETVGLLSPTRLI